MRSKSNAEGGVRKEGFVGSFHLGQEVIEGEQGSLGRLGQAVQRAGLGLETVTLGGQKSIIFDCFCPQDSQLECRGEN